jgi:Tol biopolymer transport system component
LHIIYSGSLDDDWGIFLANPDGTDQRMLSKHHRVGVFPRWSPDATAAAYSAAPSDDLLQSDIFVAHIDDAHVDNITNHPQTHEVFGDWSPDGKMIVFYVDEPDNLYLMNPAGEYSRRITNGEFIEVFTPIWRP